MSDALEFVGAMCLAFLVSAVVFWGNWSARPVLRQLRDRFVHDPGFPVIGRWPERIRKAIGGFVWWLGQFVLVFIGAVALVSLGAAFVALVGLVLP